MDVNEMFSMRENVETNKKWDKTSCWTWDNIFLRDTLWLCPVKPGSRLQIHMKDFAESKVQNWLLMGHQVKKGRNNPWRRDGRLPAETWTVLWLAAGQWTAAGYGVWTGQSVQTENSSAHTDPEDLYAQVKTERQRFGLCKDKVTFQYTSRHMCLYFYAYVMVFTSVDAEKDTGAWTGKWCVHCQRFTPTGALAANATSEFTALRATSNGLKL